MCDEVENVTDRPDRRSRQAPHPRPFPSSSARTTSKLSYLASVHVVCTYVDRISLRPLHFTSTTFTTFTTLPTHQPTNSTHTLNHPKKKHKQWSVPPLPSSPLPTNPLPRPPYSTSNPSSPSSSSPSAPRRTRTPSSQASWTATRTTTLWGRFGSARASGSG